jgi:hypothetical protein
LLSLTSMLAREGVDVLLQPGAAEAQLRE